MVYAGKCEVLSYNAQVHNDLFEPVAYGGRTGQPNSGSFAKERQLEREKVCKLSMDVTHSRPKKRKTFISLFFCSYVFMWPLLDTWCRPWPQLCERFFHSVTVPTASMQEISLPLTPESCRQRDWMKLMTVS